MPGVGSPRLSYDAVLVRGKEGQRGGRRMGAAPPGRQPDRDQGPPAGPAGGLPEPPSQDSRLLLWAEGGAARLPAQGLSWEPPMSATLSAGGRIPGPQRNAGRAPGLGGHFCPSLCRAGPPRSPEGPRGQLCVPSTPSTQQVRAQRVVSGRGTSGGSACRRGPVVSPSVRGGPQSSR